MPGRPYPLRVRVIARAISKWGPVERAPATSSSIRNALMPLRVIYHRALTRDEVAINPTLCLELPAVRGRRERVATAAEMGRLLWALQPSERALYATAFYAGPRRGEL
jgi:hypothetical protein